MLASSAYRLSASRGGNGIIAVSRRNRRFGSAAAIICTAANGAHRRRRGVAVA
jgi:hypothetical protein